MKSFVEVEGQWKGKQLDLGLIKPSFNPENFYVSNLSQALASQYLRDFYHLFGYRSGSNPEFWRSHREWGHVELLAIGDGQKDTVRKVKYGLEHAKQVQKHWNTGFWEADPANKTFVQVTASNGATGELLRDVVRTQISIDPIHPDDALQFRIVEANTLHELHGIIFEGDFVDGDRETYPELDGVRPDQIMEAILQGKLTVGPEPELRFGY